MHLNTLLRKCFANRTFAARRVFLLHLRNFSDKHTSVESDTHTSVVKSDKHTSVEEYNPFDKVANIKRAIKAVEGIKPDEFTAPTEFPEHSDVVIIGGGAIGSSIAYFLKKRTISGLSVAVVEKDPTYSQASTVLSCGGLRHQFSLPENIEMSIFGAEFLRGASRELAVYNNDPPNLYFTPFGYLFLATEAGAKQLEANCNLQRKLGAKNELLTPTGLKRKFPWLNVDGIALGCHGLEKEGWFDPWSFLFALKSKNTSLEVRYVDGEVTGFEFRNMHDAIVDGIDSDYFQATNCLVVKTASGELKKMKFGAAVIAAGADSAKVARMARIGMGGGYYTVPLPVERRKRYVYCFACKDGPGIETPFLIDPSGMYFRREGLAGHYIAGLSPRPDEEPSVDNLDVDYNYFDERVWPLLAARVPKFESIKLKSAWAGYYDYNTFDENAIIGRHPVNYNIIFATGFSGHGIQHAPAVGRAVTELILDEKFMSIDLSRMGFDRLLNIDPLEEKNII